VHQVEPFSRREPAGEILSVFREGSSKQ
jgi:hypothetical protein